MTDQDLLFFKCSRNGCNRIFMSYVRGRKKFMHNGDIVFYDNEIGEILIYEHTESSLAKGSYLFPVEQHHNKLCTYCRKGNDLLEY